MTIPLFGWTLLAATVVNVAGTHVAFAQADARMSVRIPGSTQFATTQDYSSANAIARLRYLRRSLADGKPRENRAVVSFDLVVSHVPLSCDIDIAATPARLDAVYVGLSTAREYDPRKGKGSLDESVLFLETAGLAAPVDIKLALSHKPLWILHPELRNGDFIADVGSRAYALDLDRRGDRLYAHIAVRERTVELAADTWVTLCPVVDEVHALQSGHAHRRDNR